MGWGFKAAVGSGYPFRLKEVPDDRNTLPLYVLPLLPGRHRRNRKPPALLPGTVASISVDGGGGLVG